MSIVGGIVVSGLLQLYIPQLQFLRWVFAGSTMLFLISVVLGAIFIKNENHRPFPSLFWWGCLFLFVCVITTSFNWNGLGQVVFGWKGYFQVWGLFFGLSIIQFKPRLFSSIPRTLILISLIQVPIAFQQFLFLVPQREGLGSFGVVPVDVVAGTFGASLFGGGANAVLSLYQIFIVGGLLALWQRSQLQTIYLVVTSIFLLSPIAINESKVSILYIGLTIFVLFYRDIVFKPLRFLIVMGAMVLILVGLISSYSLMFHASNIDSPMELIEQTYFQNTENGYGKLELNRITSLTFWAAEHGSHNIVQTIFGHGLGESRESDGGVLLNRTVADSHYSGLGIGLTAVSALLWETGVIGLTAIIGLFISAFRLAGKLALDLVEKPYLSGLFSAIQAGLVTFSLSMLHKSFFVFHIGYQVFLMLLLGLLIYGYRHSDTLKNNSVVRDVQK